MQLDILVLIANILLIIVVLLSIKTGYKNGLVLSIINLFGWLFALGVAWWLYPLLSGAFTIIPISLLGSDNVMSFVLQVYLNQIVWFLIVFFIIKILTTTIIKPIVKIIGKIPLVKEINGILGAVFGVIIALFYSIIACFILSMPIISNGEQIIDESLLRYTGDVSDKVFEVVMSNSDGIKKIFAFLDQSSELSPENIDKLNQWLEKNNIKQETIDEFWEGYK